MEFEQGDRSAHSSVPLWSTSGHSVDATGLHTTPRQNRGGNEGTNTTECAGTEVIPRPCPLLWKIPTEPFNLAAPTKCVTQRWTELGMDPRSVSKCFKSARNY